ncbi:hypothetical protein DGI_4032 (plasmid) [Megalodesulfovibrio gigas DSM 1382 = ATCC 19364]|uniref:Methyltransferase type 11 domain-containing protein n=2 Tax=Megalodesulfovibrio gigas TaxID=879 RepID=T2GGB3_MEGG1|nr:hypothetical protein DGI_4032 [Megalodesulfovibrio gigas DSM 1382 = ATCC 19364]
MGDGIMFYFSDNYEYFDCLDAPESTRFQLLLEPLLGRLKDVQRPLAYQVVRQFCPEGAKVLEIGAGVPLVMEALRVSHGCQCTVADKYLGKGRGPVDAAKINQSFPDIEFIDTYVGEFDPRLREDSFDAVISVSVVEHMAHSELAAFHEDCVRVVKPGGIIFHAVDVSIDGPADQDELIALLRNFIEHPRLTALAPDRMQTLEQARMDPAVFTLSPTMWRRWRQLAPPEFDFSVYRRIASLNIGMRKMQVP